MENQKIPSQKYRTGKIIPNGVILKTHELETIVVFTELGYDVELIPKSNKYGEHTADILMSGLIWEIKCPRGKGKWLIKNTLQRAYHQSENIIIDLRKIKIPQDKCLYELEKHFHLSKRMRRLKVITKTQKVIDFSK